MSLDLVQNNNPSFDWDQAVKLAGNKPALAREILILFANSLIEELHAIREDKSLYAMDEVLRRIHKLHGAACYCGVPKLKTILANCESLLKKKHFAEFNSYFPELESEIHFVTTKALASIPQCKISA